MTTFTIHAAKTQLSKLNARAAAGEEIVIARGKEPVAKLTALKAAGKKRVFGAMATVFTCPERFFLRPAPRG